MSRSVGDKEGGTAVLCAGDMCSILHDVRLNATMVAHRSGEVPIQLAKSRAFIGTRGAHTNVAFSHRLSPTRLRSFHDRPSRSAPTNQRLRFVRGSESSDVHRQSQNDHAGANSLRASVSVKTRYANMSTAQRVSTSRAVSVRWRSSIEQNPQQNRYRPTARPNLAGACSRAAPLSTEPAPG